MLLVCEVMIMLKLSKLFQLLSQLVRLDSIFSSTLKKHTNQLFSFLEELIFYILLLAATGRQKVTNK